MAWGCSPGSTAPGMPEARCSGTGERAPRSGGKAVALVPKRRTQGGLFPTGSSSLPGEANRRLSNDGAQLAHCARADRPAGTSTRTRPGERRVTSRREGRWSLTRQHDRRAHDDGPARSTRGERRGCVRGWTLETSGEGDGAAGYAAGGRARSRGAGRRCRSAVTASARGRTTRSCAGPTSSASRTTRSRRSTRGSPAGGPRRRRGSRRPTR